MTTKNPPTSIAVGSYVCVRPSYIQENIAPENRSRYQSFRGFVSHVGTTVSVVAFDHRQPGVQGTLPFPAVALMLVPITPQTTIRSTALDHSKG